MQLGVLTRESSPISPAQRTAFPDFQKFESYPFKKEHFKDNLMRMLQNGKNQYRKDKIERKKIDKSIKTKWPSETE